MEKKARDFINMDVNKYIPLKMIKKVYWSSGILWLIPIVAWAVGKVLFPIVFTIVWHVLYLTFVCILQSKRVKKTFELRFLTNGVMGVMLSALFWGLHTVYQLLQSNQPVLQVDHYLWTLLAYFIFSGCLIFFTVLGVRKGIYGKMKRKNISKRVIILEGVLASILPISGVLGMYTSKLLRSQANVEIQDIVANICWILAIFLPGLAHINFLQYYYCKKYGITSSEDGQTTSPMLEPPCRKKIQFGCSKRDNVSRKANKPLSILKMILKIILFVLVGIASLFVFIFLVFFVKAII